MKYRIGIGIITIISVLTLFGCGNKPTEDEMISDIQVENKSNEENKKARKSNKRELVEDADYTYGDLEGETYSLINGEEQYSIEDIIVPYINIASEDAKKANKEIKTIFEDSAKQYEQILNNIQLQNKYITLSYDNIINDNVLSVVLTIEKGTSDDVIDDVIYKYYAYNFDIKTGEKLKYKDIYEKVGFTEKNIDEKVKEQLKIVLESYQDNDFKNGESKQMYYDLNNKHYEEAVENNTLVYSLNEYGKLEIGVIIDTPLYKGEDSFDKFVIE